MSKNSPAGFLWSLNVTQNNQSGGSGGHGSGKDSGLNTLFHALVALLRSSLLSAYGGTCHVSRWCTSEWNEMKTTRCSHSVHANHYSAHCYFTWGVFRFLGLAMCNLEYHSKVWRKVEAMSDAPLLIGHIKAGYNREAWWYLVEEGKTKEVEEERKRHMQAICFTVLIPENAHPGMSCKQWLKSLKLFWVLILGLLLTFGYSDQLYS